MYFKDTVNRGSVIRVSEHHAMMAHAGVEVKLQVFLIPASGECE
jgi:hypothetical protein